MSAKNFTTSFLVEKSPEEVTKAITNMRGWWSEGIQGDIDILDAEIVHSYQDVHYCKLKLIELTPGKKVVWLVLENYFKFTEDKTEWIGTKLVFDVSRKGNQTEVKFTHEGLVPQYECYEICSEAWTNYINDSLHDFITRGKGQPNPKEEGGFNAALVEKWKLNS